MNKKLEEVLKAGVKERKDITRTLSKEMLQKNDNFFFSQSDVDELNAKIMYLQNEKLQLEETMLDFVANKLSFCITENMMPMFVLLTRIFFVWS